MAPQVICDHTAGLSGHQRYVCRLHPDVMLSVADAAHLAVRECQKQFRNSRWNCSVLPRDATVFGKVTVHGTHADCSLSSSGSDARRIVVQYLYL